MRRRPSCSCRRERARTRRASECNPRGRAVLPVPQEGVVCVVRVRYVLQVQDLGVRESRRVSENEPNSPPRRPTTSLSLPHCAPSLTSHAEGEQPGSERPRHAQAAEHTLSARPAAPSPRLDLITAIFFSLPLVDNLILRHPARRLQPFFEHVSIRWRRCGWSSGLAFSCVLPFPPSPPRNVLTAALGTGGSGSEGTQDYNPP